MNTRRKLCVRKSIRRTKPKQIPTAVNKMIAVPTTTPGLTAQATSSAPASVKLPSRPRTQTVSSASGPISLPFRPRTAVQQKKDAAMDTTPLFIHQRANGRTKCIFWNAERAMKPMVIQGARHAKIDIQREPRKASVTSGASDASDASDASELSQLLRRVGGSKKN